MYLFNLGCALFAFKPNKKCAEYSSFPNVVKCTLYCCLLFLAVMDFKRRNGGPFMGGGTQAKRSKGTGEWEDSPSQFEEELSMFDEEMDAEDMEGQAGHDVIPVGRC